MRNSVKTLEELNLRLKGYHKTFRGRYLFIQNKVLKNKEFILWDFSFSVLADWDKLNHPDLYGTFGHTGEEIAQMLGWSPSKVSNAKSALIKLGLWKDDEKGRTIVCGFDIRDSLPTLTEKFGVLDLQKYISIPQIKIAKLQEIGVPENKELPRTTSDYQEDLITKDSLGFSSKNGFTIRSDKEYQEVLESGGYSMLTVEDMKWIDMNVKETISSPV